MKNNKSHTTPWWLFAAIAIGALVASGIYIGIMSVEGANNNHLIKASAFAVLGLVMFWGAFAQQ